jgi:hypothetical protein
MDEFKLTSGGYLRSVKIVLYSLVAGLVLFALIVFFLNSIDALGNNTTDLKNTFLLLIPVFVVGGLIASRVAFRKRLETIDRSSGLSTKLSDYRSALIVQFALLEGPAMLATIASLVTGEMLFLLFTVFIIGYFLTAIPGKEKIIRDLNLDLKEEAILNDPDHEIL